MKFSIDIPTNIADFRGIEYTAYFESKEAQKAFNKERSCEGWGGESNFWIDARKGEMDFGINPNQYAVVARDKHGEVKYSHNMDKVPVWVAQKVASQL